MNISANQFSSIEQMSEQIRSRTAGAALNQEVQETIQKQQTGNTFAQVLKKQSIKQERELKFSRHAAERMASRKIDLTGEQKERLENAVVRADAKGIRESLVMLDDMAFIVNVPNHTVITAVSELDAAVFTNIDGAVIS